MIIQRKPMETLQPYIDLIWYVDEYFPDEDKRQDVIMPSGHLHLAYNFEDPYYLIEKDKTVRMPENTLAGQYKKAKTVRYGYHVKQLGIAVRPSASFMLFEIIGSIYTEAVVDANSIKGLSKLNDRVHQIFEGKANNEKSVSDRLSELENFLNTLVKEDKKNQELEAMIQYLEENEGQIDVKQMADAFHYSVSSLERNFKKYLGLTPKAYANIIRFRQSMLHSDPTVLFYDQSHYIKTCMAYTGKAPMELMNSEELTLVQMMETDVFSKSQEEDS